MKTDPRCSEPGGGSAPFVVRRLRAGRGRGRAGPEEFPRCPSATMGSAPYRSLLPLLLSPLSLLPAVCGDCGPLPNISRAEPPEDVRHQDSFPVGSEVTYRCLQNFSKIPSRLDTIVCFNNSLWSNLQEFCDRSCQSPPQVPFAKLSEEDEMKNFYAVGTTVRYNCSRGYENSSAVLPSSTCQENSTWSEVPELCRKRSCGPPVNPEHGKVVVTDHLYRARAEVVCDKGYTPSTKEPFIMCFAKGDEVAWTSLPKCLASPSVSDTTAVTDSTTHLEEKASENNYILPLILVPSIIGSAVIIAWSINKCSASKKTGSYKPNPGDEEQNPSQKEHRAEGCAGAAAAES